MNCPKECTRPEYRFDVPADCNMFSSWAYAHHLEAADERASESEAKAVAADARADALRLQYEDAVHHHIVEGVVTLALLLLGTAITVVALWFAHKWNEAHKWREDKRGHAYVVASLVIAALVGFFTFCGIVFKAPEAASRVIDPRYHAAKELPVVTKESLK